MAQAAATAADAASTAPAPARHTQPLEGSSGVLDHELAAAGGFWLFGYGSLVWKPGDVPTTETHDGYIEVLCCCMM